MLCGSDFLKVVVGTGLPMALANLFSHIRDFWHGGIGFDLGTANTLVYVRGRGIVVNQPSYLALRDSNSRYPELVAIGQNAKDMLGKTPQGIEVVAPIKEGVIANFNVAQVMLRHLVKASTTRDPRFKSFGIISVPALATQIERRAMEEAAEQAQLGKVFFIQEVMAAALGAGLDVLSARGALVVDIGGGTTDAAIMALGGIVASHSCRTAGNALDERVQQYVKHAHNLNIGLQSAERVKIAVGTTKPGKGSTVKVRGSDIRDGLPREISLNEQEIFEAIQGPIDEIVSVLCKVLEETPPELLTDINDIGVTLVGGGSMLRGIDRTLAESTGVPVFVAEDPLCSAAFGLGTVIQNFQAYEPLLDMEY